MPQRSPRLASCSPSHRVGSFAKLLLQAIELLRPEAADAGYPVGQLPHPFGVEFVEPFLRLRPYPNELGVAKRPQMLRNRRSADVEAAGDVTRRKRARSQHLNDPLAGGIRKDVQGAHWDNYVANT